MTCARSRTSASRPRRRHIRAGRLVAALALALPLVAPAGAGAVAVPLDGNPLNVFVGDTGRLQARFDGETRGEFYDPDAEEANAGFNLVTHVGDESAQVWGYLGQSLTPISQSPVEGGGTEGNPLRQTTVYRAGPTLRDQSTFTITQQVFYVHGSDRFHIRYTVSHDGGNAPVVVRPSLSADLFVRNSDAGQGLFVAGPPRFVGGINSQEGAIGGILELTPWAHFEEDLYTTVNTHVTDTAPGGALDDSVNPALVDNGVGVQWTDTPLCAGCTSGGQQAATYEAIWRFRRFEALDISPDEARRVRGERHTVTASARNVEGQPIASQRIRYEVVGANPTAGSNVTGPEGDLAISWVGNQAGLDTVHVYADENDNGVRDETEPQRSATVEWLQDPQPGSSANVQPLSGEVYVRLPRGASPARYGLSAKPSQNAPAGFIPLADAAQIPVRSIVDTSRGKVLVASSKGTAGGVQKAQFFSGRFQIVQRRQRRAVTEMVLKGGTYRGCPRVRASGAGADADSSQRRRSSRSRVRRLWGNGRGRYRTRGRYSSATVRGTRWLTEDRCGGTLTRVSRRPRTSRVDVRDHVRDRTIRLRAGQSYFARAGKR